MWKHLRTCVRHATPLGEGGRSSVVLLDILSDIKSLLLLGPLHFVFPGVRTKLRKPQKTYYATHKTFPKMSHFTLKFAFSVP